MNVAAIDCGTNSTRLLIADGRGRGIAREMRITRLGQDVDATGSLAPAALARTYAVLEEYATLLRTHQVGRTKLIATSAARDADNGAQFLERAAAITGAEVALLSGREEAELSYRGATADLAKVDVPTMIVDIGGGSTELAAVIDDELVAFSMQLGCVRLSERALGPSIVTHEGSDAARQMISSELDRAFDASPALASLVGHMRMVGLAGTVSTLAQLDAELAVYERDAVHHRHLSIGDVERWRVTLGAETPEQRLTRPGMVPGREDVLVAGLFVLEAVMVRFGAAELLSSESDILDGLVATMTMES